MENKMKRIIYMFIRGFGTVLRLVVNVNKMGKADNYTQTEKYEVIREKVVELNKAGKIKIEVHGKENLPEKSGYIIFSNHQSVFDILCLIESDPTPFSIVYKMEISNWIFFGNVMKCLNSIPINRKSKRQSIEAIRSVSKRVMNGANVLMFPEGTWSKIGNELLLFKSGSFKSAIWAKCPIVPVVLIDAYIPYQSHNTKEATVKVYYLKPLYYEDYIGLNSKELSEKIRNSMLRVTKK